MSRPGCTGSRSHGSARTNRSKWVPAAPRARRGSRPSFCTPSPSAWIAQITLCRQGYFDRFGSRSKARSPLSRTETRSPVFGVTLGMSRGAGKAHAPSVPSRVSQCRQWHLYARFGRRRESPAPRPMRNHRIFTVGGSATHRVFSAPADVGYSQGVYGAGDRRRQPDRP